MVVPDHIDLRALLAAELEAPDRARWADDPVIAAFVAILTSRHPGAMAVIFYGSGLRDGVAGDTMLDFYLVVDELRPAFPGRRWLAWAGALIPPNVFHLTVEAPPMRGAVARAKYAVLSAAQMRRATSPAAWSVSLWARFAQPVALVWARDPAARRAVVEALAASIETAMARVAPLPREAEEPATFWRTVFATTYGAELRAERKARADALVAAEQGRWQRLTVAGAASLGMALDGAGRVPVASPMARSRARRAWLVRRLAGKAISIARLLKAMATFDGGIDYIIWKIERHSGRTVTVRPWERRWPLLGVWTAAWRLYRQGAIR